MHNTATFQAELWALVDVLLGLFLGALIGLEREWRSKPAGFRTHAFVAGACTGVIVLAPWLLRELAEGLPPESLRNEPLSLVHAVFVGVGFIAGGLAIKDIATKQVINLTTAATLLWAAVVGVAVGASFTSSRSL
jgi:putative Mg2+ transporter-C (MgtC) family protein